MKGDYSRFTFDARRHASSVRKQQGRVDLDADWNEQQAIDGYWRTTVLTDVVGPDGAPIDAAGFGLVAAGADLQLTAGRLYVAGTLCQNEAVVSVFDQPDLPAGSPVLRNADGTFAPIPPLPGAAVYIAYVDVWSQHRTAVEDPSLREVALGGPDTTTRVRTVWQVRLLAVAEAGAVVSCGEPAGWAELTAASTGTLAAWSDPTGTPTSDCLVPLSAPYRGLDNQLYRVEIRSGGAPGAATYVWSRDNGSVLAGWVGRNGDVLNVKNPGRDGSTGFTNGCWAQLTDDRTELRGEFGTLAQVDRVEGDQLILKAGTATGSLDLADFPVRPRVRRWDGHGTVPADGSEVPLELGVKTRFSAVATDHYGTSDYWTFAARAAVHDVEWPRTGATPEALVAHGPRHAFARLGVVSFDGATWTVDRDCRDLFAPLSDQRTLDHLSGDGQTATPSVVDATALVPLPHALLAGVTMGGRPVAGARVQFRVTAGNGHVNGFVSSDIVTTGADGVASCTWEVDSGTATQEVAAALLDEGDQPSEPGIGFVATLLTAAGVAYDPVDAPTLAGSANVKDALDRLAVTTGNGCSTLTLAPGNGWVEALEGLPAGQDATVCFRPGRYTSPRPVTLIGLGHLRLSGGGPATVLQVREGEAALVIDSCASVTVEDLAVVIDAFPLKPVSGQLGVVTVTNSADVAVERARLRCPADIAPRATCLTVRSGGEVRSDAATRSVRVTDCEFDVGHDQTGVLVVNSHRTRVTGCSFATPPKPGSVTFDRLVGAPARKGKLVSRLVRDLVIDAGARIERGDLNTAFRVGPWAVRLNSTVPEAEWRALVAAIPPAEDDLADVGRVNGYLDRLTDAAAAEPARLPAFERSVTSLRARLGDASDRVFGTVEGRETVRGLLKAGAFEVRPTVDVVRDRRAVEITAGRSAVRFDSPIPQQTWLSLLQASPPPLADNPAAVASHLRLIAGRLVAEADFGSRFAAGFLGTLVSRNPAAARKGVVIGGAIVGDVTVEGNRITGATEAVHVGTSLGRSVERGPDLARSVRIRGNEIALVVPLELEASPRAIFVGNVVRAFIEDNNIDASPSGILRGIEVFGNVGAHGVVRDNAVVGSRTGIFLRFTGSIPSPSLWIVQDNVLWAANRQVDAPPAVRQSGNVG